MPISAEPASRMIVRTSAKSRLTRPGTVIRSVMPWTPCRRMSSAMPNASVTGVFLSTTWRSRSFSITISVSTRSRRFWIPTSACSARRRPSKPNGRVTTPTVECLELAAELGHDGSGAGSRAAALTGGDEDHVGALERLLQLVARLLRRGETDRRVGAGPEAARRFRADVDLDVGVRHQERLRVRVDRDELDAAQARLDHAIDRVGPAATDADHLDHREVVATLCAHEYLTSTCLDVKLLSS